MNYFEIHSKQTGYKPKTTFWNDFSIADPFGVKSIKDTYNRAFNEWKGNAEYLTELVMVLNLKLWYYYECGNLELAKVYDNLWKQADAYACDNLKGEDLKYFIRTID